MYARLILLSTFLALLTPFCKGATVAIDDGHIYDGTLIAEDEYGYLMDINGMRVQLPRSKVTAFSKDSVPHDKVTITPTAPSRPVVKKYGAVETTRLQEKPAEQPAVPAPAPNPNEAQPAVPPAPAVPPPAMPLVSTEIMLPMPSDAVKATELNAAIDAFREDADPTNRSLAIETLRRSGDFGLTALIEHGLYNQSPNIRATSAQLLGDLGGRRVLRYMIEAFYAAGTELVPPYNREYVRVLTTYISRMTGQDFYFYERRSNRGPEIAQKMEEWWSANWEKVPPQLGEPIFDSSKPDYRDLVRQVRLLHLEHHEYAGTNLSLDIAAPPVPNSAAAYSFMQTIPIVPRSSINSGALFTWGGTPPVEKIPSEALFYPGTVRRQEFAAKLRDWAASQTIRVTGP
jgi:hypothetical protein